MNIFSGKSVRIGGIVMELMRLKHGILNIITSLIQVLQKVLA